VNARSFYEARAKSIVKDLREDKGLSYRELARRLGDIGVPMDEQVLINRLNRGRFSFAFALQVLAAMGVDVLPVPKPTSRTKAR
jgi:transcriptional regulator with XRE-family HTH domain